ncbi:metal-dependent hydrolase family protein [Halorussus salinisoli]|uniref:metal-dependent hydrolase family protein n=1 Tax=Halorussus salinisoli TaxID=2558242 RepID=UPI0010C1CE56|nr:amidohydrolase family protein [Halorussus salinisoli]
MKRVVTADRVLTPDRTIEPGMVIHEGGRILDAGTAGEITIPSTVDEEVNLDGYSILPGLVDGHVHLTGTGVDVVPPRGPFEESIAGSTIRAVENARRTLHAGVTTVRDLGGPNEVVFELRDRIDAGDISGPRVIAAGQGLSTTGGHGDTVPERIATDEMREQSVTKSRVVDGQLEVRRAIRSQLKWGADVIKVWATDGVTDESGGHELHFTPTELTAASEEARNRDVPVAAHAHCPEGIQACLDAGVRSIEHGIWMDEESMNRIAESEVYLTLTYATMFALVEDERRPEWMRDNADRALDHHLSMLPRARERGVAFAMGTDAGTALPNGHNGRELELMIREGGFDPEDTIEVCTERTAAMLGLDDVGRIEQGYIADFIAVKGDPIEDAELLSDPQNIHLVVKDGEVMKDELG